MWTINVVFPPHSLRTQQQELTIFGADVVDGPGRPHLHGEGLRGRHQREEGAEGAIGDHLLLRGLPLADHRELQVATIHIQVLLL